MNGGERGWGVSLALLHRECQVFHALGRPRIPRTRLKLCKGLARRLIAMAAPYSTSTPAFRSGRWLSTVLACTLVLVLAVLPPFVGPGWREALLHGFHGVCHQLPERSFQFGGVPFALRHRDRSRAWRCGVATALAAADAAPGRVAVYDCTAHDSRLDARRFRPLGEYADLAGPHWRSVWSRCWMGFGSGRGDVPVPVSGASSFAALTGLLASRSPNPLTSCKASFPRSSSVA